VTAVHDISDGGLAQCLAEMALASNSLGAEIALEAHAPHIALFAEDQARYVVTCPADKAKALAERALDSGIPAEQIGEVTATGGLIVWPGASISQEELRNSHEGWFPGFMGANPA
jgi:phosphoribosylformylglycinamidine synthase